MKCEICGRSTRYRCGNRAVCFFCIHTGDPVIKEKFKIIEQEIKAGMRPRNQIGMKMGHSNEKK